MRTYCSTVTYDLEYKSVKASDRARDRLKDEVARQGVSQRDLAKRLQKRDPSDDWTQGRVAKILNGKVKLTVDAAELFAEELGVPVAELFRERGREWSADLSPSELALVERYRSLPSTAQSAATVLLSSAFTSEVIQKRKGATKLSHGLQSEVRYKGGTKPIHGRSVPQGYSDEMVALRAELAHARAKLTELALIASKAATISDTIPAAHAPKAGRGPVAS